MILASYFSCTGIILKLMVIKIVYNTPPFQDAFTHQIWDSYLKEYRRCAPDMKRDGHTDGRTDGQCDYYTCMPPQIPFRHKIYKACSNGGIINEYIKATVQDASRCHLYQIDFIDFSKAFGSNSFFLNPT